MNIREKENDLFSEWQKKYEDSSFVIDGCPNPEVYIKEKIKIVFVLKDANLGSPDSSNRIYDQREELEHNPIQWWETIARWSYFFKMPSASWCRAEKEVKTRESIRDLLGHHCIVQLKKAWGGGSVENETLADAVKKDKNEIVNQLSIYAPRFIVACGNGEHLAEALDLKNTDFRKTSAGIGYWETVLANKPCYVIDYCHPSNRAGTKVRGLIAIGLSLALMEIEKMATLAV